MWGMWHGREITAWNSGDGGWSLVQRCDGWAH